MNTQINIRPVSAIRALLSYGEDGSVQLAKRDDKTPALNVDEIALVTVEDAKAAKSATLRAVNTVRIARGFPDVVTAAVIDVAGKVTTPKNSTPAFDYILAKVERECGSDAAFQNLRYLIGCADLVANSGLPCSPFAVKESLGYLKKVGAVPEILDAKSKVSMGKAGKVGAALKEGTGVNAMRPVLKAARAAKPALFPTGSGKKAAKAVVVAKDDADKVSRDIQVIIQRWDKLAAGDAGKALRKACGESVGKLAVLAGLVVSK